MWTAAASITTTAAPEAVWRLFEDVPGWKAWNAGIERIELQGDFASGTRFLMQPPGMAPFTSTLLDVRHGHGFTDETILDGTAIVVSHELQALPDGGTRITYRTRASGPAAAEIGPLASADFPAVLAALKALAERA